jgi:hypothetical protein
LRNLQSTRCPECGEALKLSVTVVDAYLKAWISLLVVACAGAGLGILWLLMMTTRGFPPSGTFQITIVIHLLMVPVVPILLARRRAFLRLQRPTQWSLAWFGILAFAASVLFMITDL